MRTFWTLGLVSAVALVAAACGGDDGDATTTGGTGGTNAGTGGSNTGTGGTSSGTGGTTTGTGAGGMGGAPDPGPAVDLTDPQLYEVDFSADEADPAADERLGTQHAMLDTRVTPLGYLVVFLHGAGDPGNCGSTAHLEMLAGLGFHTMSPCYHSGYGVGNCGDDIEGCRLEAFEGVDHHPLIDIAPPNSAETRVTKGLEYLQAQVPEGDWTYFIDGDTPRWDRILITGSSHGASSSGVIGLHRSVVRVVSLAGPLDSNQAWLSSSGLTPKSAYWGFTHTGDGQHPGHLAAFEALGLPGAPTNVDDVAAPYGGSHRLFSDLASVTNGHGAVTAGGASPQAGGDWVYLPVWTTMYTEGLPSNFNPDG